MAPYDGSMRAWPRWFETEEAAAARFRDRFDAGRVLAGKLSAYANHPDAIVLALPRGGVAVGYEVAKALNLPLDVFIVRKLGVPGHEELAMGAVATGGVRVLNEPMVRSLGLDRTAVDEVIAREEEELCRREAQYRGKRPPPALKDRVVILVDDGIATGATMWAAITAVRKHQPARVVMAVPIADPSTCDGFSRVADDVVCARTVEPFYAVGAWYQDFPQMTDDEVRALLAQSRQETRAAS